MIVDSSAFVAVILAEPESRALETILATADRIAVPAPVLVEVGLRLERLPQADEATRRFDTLLTRLDAQVEPFLAEDAPAAIEAYRRYGKGQGHPAQLNFGDCMVYATARRVGLPLLCLGGDFAATDLPLVPVDADR